MVQTKKVEVEVTKEASEVFELIESLIRDIRAKKSIVEISGGNLPKLVTAIEGYDQLDDEAKDEHFDATVGMGLAQISRALRAKPAA